MFLFDVPVCNCWAHAIAFKHAVSKSTPRLFNLIISSLQKLLLYQIQRLVFPVCIHHLLYPRYKTELDMQPKMFLLAILFCMNSYTVFRVKFWTYVHLKLLFISIMNIVSIVMINICLSMINSCIIIRRIFSLLF